jgi:uncharacterized protein
VKGGAFQVFIRVKELELEKLEFDQSYAPGAIDFGPDVSQKGALKAQGRAELIEEHHGPKQVVQDIRVVGEFGASFELRCARCLEVVPFRLNQDFDLLYRPQGIDAGKDEISITVADAEIGYYRGGGLQLEDLLKEQVLLGVPFRTLCRENCQGLCPQCGRNLNQGACECVRESTDPRWSALAGLKEKFKDQG